MFRSTSLLVVGTFAVFSPADADPHLYCAINETPYCGTPSEVMRAYNELHRQTSIISDLNFELMQSRTELLRNLIDSRTDEMWLSDWLPDAARFYQANRVFYQYFKPGSYFDPISTDPHADLNVTDRFGNAALVYANSELAWGNSEVFGTRMGTWVAGGGELFQRSRELLGSISSGEPLKLQTKNYFQDFLLSPIESFSRAYDNDLFDYLINEETGRYLDFESRFYTEQIISRLTYNYEPVYSILDGEYGFDEVDLGVPYFPLDEGYFSDSDLFFGEFYDFPYDMEEDRPDWKL